MCCTAPGAGASFRCEGRVTADLGSPEDFLTQLSAYRKRIQPLLLEALPDREPSRYLYGLIKAMLERPGKGLRPALCIATCKAYGGDERLALPTAAALELLHNALLVHDDVEDESELRRDEPTLHRTHGVPLAVNTGDAMNALTLGLLMKNRDLVGPGLTWHIVEEFNHLLIQSLEGQAMELGWIRENNTSVSTDDYLLMVLKKTCWYSFIHPCRLGALLAGQSELERFDLFGFLTGAAFQIQDDILNLVGERSRYGKEIGGDLWEGKRTLMLSHAFEQVRGRQLERLQTILGKPRQRRLQREIDWIADLLGETGSIDHAREAALELAKAAKQQFDAAFATAPESGAKTFLRQFVWYMVDRDL